MFIWWNPVFHFPLSGDVTQEILHELRRAQADLRNLQGELRQSQEFLSATAQAIVEVADQTGTDIQPMTGSGIAKLRALSAKFQPKT